MGASQKTQTMTNVGRQPGRNGNPMSVISCSEELCIRVSDINYPNEKALLIHRGVWIVQNSYFWRCLIVQQYFGEPFALRFDVYGRCKPCLRTACQLLFRAIGLSSHPGDQGILSTHGSKQGFPCNTSGKGICNWWRTSENDCIVFVHRNALGRNTPPGDRGT